MEVNQVFDIDKKFKSQEYRLLNKIGQGGFGSVYRAKKLNTDQYVAIKILNLNSDLDEVKRKRYIDRFHREAALSGLLQHSNIVRLLDKGICDQNLIYAVFEYVEGESLKEILQKEMLAPPLVANLMGQVLDALSHAHEKGVIHRDLKPANIMLIKKDSSYNVKILDFGIATFTLEARGFEYKTITLTQETLGTPSYSAPEQLRGEPPTPKTDLYVWGLVFLECLTGQPAISGGSLASIFHKQLSPDNVPFPPAIAGHPIAELLRRVLNKKSSERISTAAGIYQELGKINFSTLVGNFKNIRIDKDLESNNRVFTDETIINDCSFSYTGMTERRQITALSICINIRTALKGGFDHEVIDALHRDQKSQCQDIAIRYGAFHAGTLGDMLLFYFGYPVVSDNDIRLCARAALDIVSGINKRNVLLKSSQGLEVIVGVGMHTGLVTCYTDISPEGDTPNISLQLSREAGNNQIVCTETSQKILDGYIKFDFMKASPLGAHFVSTPLFSLVGEREVEVFGFLRGTRKNDAFIGRDQEMCQLEGILNQTLPSLNKSSVNIINESSKLKTEGELKYFKARLGHVYGEAGIGKSRLIFELRNSSIKMQHIIAQCLPEHQNNALYPILNILKYRYHLDSLSSQDAFERLRHVIFKLDSNLIGGKESNKEQCLLILCSWLSLSTGDGIVGSILPPAEQKRLLFLTLAALLINRGELVSSQSNDAIDYNTCKLFIFEDMHWADSTSLEFVAQFVQGDTFINEGDSFISTSRQSLPDPLIDFGFELIPVKKLTMSATSEYILSLFNNDDVSKNVLDAIIERTDGIPLFIEELVNMLQQKKLVYKLNGIVNFVNPEQLEQVPNNLRDSLHQKLDALVYAKETAQLAATIGREFDYDLLVIASTRSESQIQNDLDELVDCELVFRQRRVDGDGYIFKHALVRDAAYESLSRAIMQESHFRIASSMVERFSSQSDKEPLIVAKHYYRAKDFVNAIKYGVIAIQYLGKKSLYKEAVDLETEVRLWVKLVKNKLTESECNIRLNATLLPIKTMLEGWGNKSVYALAESNLSLVESIRKADDKINENHKKIISESELDSIEFKSKWTAFFNSHLQGQRGKEGKARAMGEDLLKEVLSNKGTSRDVMRVREMVTRVVLAQAYFFDGSFHKAKASFSNVMELYDENMDGDLYIEYVLDPYLFSAGNLICINVVMGDHEESKRNSELCLKYAKNTKNSANIVTAYTFGAVRLFITNDSEAMKRWTMEAVNVYGESLESSWVVCYFHMLYDWPDKLMKRSAETVCREQEKGLDGFMAWYAASLADTYIHHGQYDKAITLMKSIINRSISFGEPCILSMNYRFLANAHYRKSGYLCDGSIDAFQHAIQNACDTGASWLEYQAINDYLLCEPAEDIYLVHRRRLKILEESINV